MSSKTHRLWYRQPATNFNEALPLGNGRLGAMVYGGVARERLNLNEDTLWAGTAAPLPRPQGPQALQVCRGLLRQKRYREAQRYVAENLLTEFNQPYLPAGDLCLDVPKWERQEPEEYRRELDLASAETLTSFRINGCRHHRSCLVSAVDQVFVWNWESDGECLPDFRLFLSSQLDHELSWDQEGGSLIGRAPTRVVWPGVDTRFQKGEGITYAGEGEREGCRFAIQLRLLAPGADLAVEPLGMRVSGAKSLALLVAIATDAQGAAPLKACAETLERAAPLTWEQLRERHGKEHGSSYDRVELKLGSESSGDEFSVSTDELLPKEADQKVATQLAALTFHYGRYLLLSSSRPGTQPANLMGIWNNLVQPPWWSNYTMNINLQMNYWPAEVCNLSECHEPLFTFMEELQRSGEKTARVHYGCRGWCAHHQTDWHRQTTPVGKLDGIILEDAPCYAMWPLAGAWLCRHLWEHFQYGGGEHFLRERAWPVIKGAAEFVFDWLVEDPETKNYITAPSTSPENFFRLPTGAKISMGTNSAMDLSIIRDLLILCRSAIQQLQLSEQSFLAEVEDKLCRLAPLQFDQEGGIEEMSEGWKQWEPGHRHLSHLYGLFPGEEFLDPSRPALREAAKRSLELRGEAGTGWSLAWKLCLQARLQDAAACGRLIRQYFQRVPSWMTEPANDGGGTYPNLLAACPPMMMDANFGYTAAVAEMLLQSQSQKIHLLPALPEEWRHGSFRGLRARGGVEVSAQWEDGHLKEARFLAAQGKKIALVYAGRTKRFWLDAGKEIRLAPRDWSD